MALGIGDYLKQLRTAQGLSLSRLAAKAGLGKATLSGWESGRFQPRLPELEQALDALGASLAQKTKAVSLVNASRAVQELKQNAIIRQLEERLGQMPSGSDLLKAMRLRKNLFLGQVAEGIGVNASTLSRWEQGRTIPPPESLERLLTFLGAYPEEREALINGQFLFVSPLRESPRSMDEIEAELFELTDGNDGEFNYSEQPLFDLRFLRLEAQAWRWAAQKPAAQQLLAHISTYHALHLGFASRFQEMGNCSYRALDLMPGKGCESDFWIMAAIYAAIYEGRSAANSKPESGIDLLQRWAVFPCRPALKSTLLDELSQLCARRNDHESAIHWIDAALVTVEDENVARMHLRNKAECLIKAGRPMEALPLIEMIKVEKAPPYTRVWTMLIEAQALMALGDRPAVTERLEEAFPIIEEHDLTIHRIHATRLANGL